MDGSLPSRAVPRARLRVRGLVQGVGFRPFVHRLATEFGVSGSVRNDAAGVLIDAAGGDLEGFRAAILSRLPPLARIEAIEAETLPAAAMPPGFAILGSLHDAGGTMIGPDVAPCADCLRELFDPADRRHLYPFLNCTQCGPRFTITAALPYDRPRTALAGFPLCAACAREFRNPADRRFHAQAIACPACGPRLSLPVAAILARLRAGAVLAIKGIGGFHLVCDARNPAAIARLRAAKRRDAKPLALMAANAASLDGIVMLDPAARAALQSAARPILLCRRAPHGDVPDLGPDLAPGLGWLGVMLPYAPLHWLLFHEAAGRPAGTAWCAAPQPLLLVVTSANPSDEPLAIDGADPRLAGLADAIIDHDRPILARADDPVLRVIAGEPRPLRRGRGDTPLSIPLAVGGPPVVALGARLKAAVAVLRDNQAFLSQHVGDLDNAATAAAQAAALHHLTGLLGIAPVLVAHDLHPDLPSRRLAAALGLPGLAVQHHHAHIASVLAEHGIDHPMLGLALDGHGHGADGTAWGGELLAVDGARCDRLGHFAPLPLPGGDAAARQPWRMAAAALHLMGRGQEIAVRFADQPLAAGVSMLLAAGRTPTTTACGRLFDAAAGLLGISATQRYEAEAAMRLESLVDRPRVLPGAWRIRDGVLDLLPLLAALEGRAPVEGAALFHGTLAAALIDWVQPYLVARGARRIALGGGCLANAVLAETLVGGFAAQGIVALLPRAAPCGDAGLALGQAWVARQRLREEGLPCA